MGYNCCFFLNFVPLHIESHYNFGGTGPILGYIGDRKTNLIHTKRRHRCSGLNADLYRVNLKNDPRCVCGHLFEDAIHFFLECSLYQHDRTSLFNYFNKIVPISIEYILFGCNEISEELNTLLFKSVQKFIRQTCRFNNYYPQP